MEESLPSEHGGELLGDSLEQLLDGGGVTDEGGGHLETSGRNVANGNLDIVGNPLDKVAAVLVLDVQHLLINLKRRDFTEEYRISSLLGYPVGYPVSFTGHPARYPDNRIEKRFQKVRQIKLYQI